MNNNSRCIRITGEIDEDAFAEFSKRLTELENQSVKPIYVELCSGGGTPEAALAFYSRMRISKVDIEVHVYGHASSAASLILAAGTRRYMAKEAWVMVHEESQELSGDTRTLENETKQMRRAENAWNVLMSNRTKGSATFWEELNKKTTYLSADECLELGLIDEII